MFLLPLAQVHTLFGQLVLHYRLPCLHRFGQAGTALTLVKKIWFVFRGALPHKPYQFSVAFSLPLPRLALLILCADQGGEPFQAVAAIFGDAALQFVLFDTLHVTQLTQSLDLRFLTSRFIQQRDNTLIQQTEFQQCKIRFKRLATTAQLFCLCHECRMMFAVPHQRQQQSHLSFGLQHRFVRPVQVVKMADQGRDARRHIKWLKHMAAYKIGQVAD